MAESSVERSTPAAIAVAVIGSVVVLALVGLLIVGAVSTWGALDAEVQAAVIVAVATLVGIGLTRVAEQRLAQRRAEHERKRDVYETFIKNLMDVFELDKPDSVRRGVDESKVLSFLADFTKSGVVWSSPGVLRAWTTFRRRSMNADAEDGAGELMYELENVFRAIRKDLGVSNRGLQRGDFLRLFVNDIDD